MKNEKATTLILSGISALFLTITIGFCMFSTEPPLWSVIGFVVFGFAVLLYKIIMLVINTK